MSDKDEILFQTRGKTGFATLNRPSAFNALTLGMVHRLAPQLEAWCGDSAIEAVVIRGTGEKAFCAGGDIVSIYRDRNPEFGETFFRDEYRLNRAIKRYPKPYIALIDGVTMGGGVGVSVHGRFRVATERTVMAMPETAIGFFPDVGGTYFLPRLPHQLGLFMALTGWRIKAAECLASGIATHYVESHRIAELEEALAVANLSAGHAAVASVIESFAGSPGPSSLSADLPAIERCFSRNSVAEIIEALSDEEGVWAEKSLGMIRRQSPTSLLVTYRQIRAGADLSFEDAMILEYRLSQAFLGGHDFYEGIRAMVIDKDQKPQWDPSELTDVKPEAVERCFESLGARDLTF